jgi:GntR family transcriptional regulator/MocR family aminotransferase
MSASRRLQLLEWSQATGAWLIEDDYDSEYRYESQPIAALQGLDRDQRVIYVGTFSKVLFPALRVAYMVIPPDLVEQFAAVRHAMDDCPPALNPAALADFIAEGHFGRHLRRTRALYAERRAALLGALRGQLGGQLQVIGAEAGIHLTALLQDGASDSAVAEHAARDGLWAMPLSACYLGPPARRGLVLGYGGAAVAHIPDAVRRLRRALAAAGCLRPPATGAAALIPAAASGRRSS